jgi:hypothetical protein
MDEIERISFARLRPTGDHRAAGRRQIRLPFTQQNRTIQELTRTDLIEWRSPIARLLRREELEVVGDFRFNALRISDPFAAGEPPV